MLLLDALNEILPVLGEHRVTSTSVKHPTLAIILPQLEAQRRELLVKGWWFNRFDGWTLQRNNEGFIETPADMLSFVPDCENAIARAGRLFNGDTLSYVWDRNVTGTLTLDVPFEELPETVATYVFRKALVLAYTTDIGLEQVVQVWANEAAQAKIAMEREHLRQKKYTSRRSRMYRNMRQALRGV